MGNLQEENFVIEDETRRPNAPRPHLIQLLWQAWPHRHESRRARVLLLLGIGLLATLVWGLLWLGVTLALPPEQHQLAALVAAGVLLLLLLLLEFPRQLIEYRHMGHAAWAAGRLVIPLVVWALVVIVPASRLDMGTFVLGAAVIWAFVLIAVVTPIRLWGVNLDNGAICYYQSMLKKTQQFTFIQQRHPSHPALQEKLAKLREYGLLDDMFDTYFDFGCAEHVENSIRRVVYLPYNAMVEKERNRRLQNNEPIPDDLRYDLQFGQKLERDRQLLSKCLGDYVDVKTQQKFQAVSDLLEDVFKTVKGWNVVPPPVQWIATLDVCRPYWNNGNFVDFDEELPVILQKGARIQVRVMFFMRFNPQAIGTPTFRWQLGQLTDAQAVKTRIRNLFRLATQSEADEFFVQLTLPEALAEGAILKFSKELPKLLLGTARTLGIELLGWSVRCTPSIPNDLNPLDRAALQQQIAQFDAGAELAQTNQWLKLLRDNQGVVTPDLIYRMYAFHSLPASARFINIDPLLKTDISRTPPAAPPVSPPPEDKQNKLLDMRNPWKVLPPGRKKKDDGQ